MTIRGYANVAKLTLILLCIPFPMYAVDEYESESEVRRSTWSVELKTARHELVINNFKRSSSVDENEELATAGIVDSVRNSTELKGVSTAVQLGGGYIAESWVFSASVDFILGPYKPVDESKLNVDFVGTGVTLKSSYFPFGQNLRSSRGALGILAGLTYSDIVGRTVGKSELAVGSTDDATATAEVSSYIIHINDFSGIVGLVYSGLKNPRPSGNSPELLKTRIEGYIFTLGIALPLLSEYTARFDRKKDRDYPERISGDLKGKSFIASISTLLGV